MMDSLLTHAPCGFLSFSDKREILLCNHTLSAMLGYPPGELVGRSIDTILTGGARIFYQTHFFPLLTLQGKAEEIYFSLRDANGEEVPVLANAHRREADGVAVNDCVLLRIQQRRRFEDEILQARKAADQASRAKDEFLAALSHELRTPLTPVLLTAVALESEPDLSPDVRRDLAMIRRNVELEVRLIDDLLDITRIAHGKLRLESVVTDLHVLLAHTREIVREDAERKRLDLRFSLEAEQHHVEGDPTRLQQVFWNLVKNAVKFTPDGGRIDVTTFNPGSGRVVVRVSDTGLGIEPDALAWIFNAFEQGTLGGQPRFGGLGLGLAITREIVHRHGGSIEATSEGLGCGAMFAVDLVAIPAPTKQPAIARAATGAARSLRLLLVEDHQSTRDVLARILRRSGHEVEVAGTGAEAISLAERIQFDVLISDLGLPDLSGLDLIQKLRAKHKLSGIALSGYGTEQDVARAKAAGFSAHLVKPISVDRLQEILQEIAAGEMA
ncbi:MAG: ATP-binding protein [Chthoniobacteraceae bacterium]